MLASIRTKRTNAPLCMPHSPSLPLLTMFIDVYRGTMGYLPYRQFVHRPTCTDPSRPKGRSLQSLCYLDRRCGTNPAASRSTPAANDGDARGWCSARITDFDLGLGQWNNAMCILWLISTSFFRHSRAQRNVQTQSEQTKLKGTA